MKKTLLTIIAALLLGGVVNAQGWGETDSHAKSSNTPIVASVTLDGNAVTPTADYRLGAFVGEELRGLAAPHTDNNFWIQVFYNQGTTEEITFKLWDPTGEGTELTDYTLTYGDLTALTTQEEGWGTPSEPVVLDFATTQIMTTQMVSGWNWWSTPIEMNGVNGLTMLENALGNNGVIIKDKTHSAVYYEGYNRWIGSCPITNEGSYMVQVNNGCTFSFTGTWADPDEHPIEIKANDWTWIGYPVNQSQGIASALANFEPAPGDVVKTGSVSSVYFSTALGWRPATFTFNPGVGYRYQSNATSNKTLTYAKPSGSRGLDESIIADELHWEANYNVTEGNITLIAKVYVDGLEQRDENLELGAFVNGECRGSAKLFYIEQPVDAYYVIMNIAGEEGDEIDFELFNAEDGSVKTESTTRLVFRDNDVVGEPGNPYSINFNGKNGSDIVLFPNPVNRNQTFTLGIPSCETISMVTITDVLGSTVYQKIDAKQLQINGLPTPGIYLVKVVCESGNLYYGRIVVE